MQYFYSSEIIGDKIVLRAQEAKHCSKILRKNTGDLINVLDGKGHLFRAQIADVLRDQVILKINSRETRVTRNPNLPLLAVGIIKSDSRLEWLVEKIVEIGIRGFVPLICHRSEKKTTRHERLQKIMISAMKQSVRKYLPELHRPIPFTQFISQVRDSSADKFIAHYQEKNHSLGELSRHVQESIIVIGPEGDFTEEELKLAFAGGFQPVNLNRSRLRTETAGVVACAIVVKDYNI